MLIISYLRRVLATVYKIINIIKCLKGSRSTCARISDINSRKKIIEPCYCKLEKRIWKEERIFFPKPKNREYPIRCSVRWIHIQQVPGIYVETYVYDNVYVRSLMRSYFLISFSFFRYIYIGSSRPKYLFPP